MKRGLLAKNNNHHLYIYPLLVVFSLGFIYGIYYDIAHLRLFTKPAVLITLMFYILMTADLSSWGVRFIFIGHIFSVLGDIFLELDADNLFLFGLASFLVGHSWYIPAFLKAVPRLGLSAFFKYWVPGVLWSVSILWFCLDNIGEYLLPTLVYSLALSFLMMSGTYHSSHRKDMNVLHRYAPFVGAIMFSFSDSLIALNKFRPDVFGISIVRYSIIITYWMAQTCISLTAINYDLKIKEM